MGELKPPGKPFDISNWEVQDAWEKVKTPFRARGAPCYLTSAVTLVLSLLSGVLP